MSENEKFVDRLFDESNSENIFIKDNDGKEIEFEQVAVVDYKGNFYAMLYPVTKIEGVGEDEAVVFLIDEENDQLVYVDDEEVIDGVYVEYCKMIEEQE